MRKRTCRPLVGKVSSSEIRSALRSEIDSTASSSCLKSFPYVAGLIWIDLSPRRRPKRSAMLPPREWPVSQILR